MERGKVIHPSKRAPSQFNAIGTGVRLFPSRELFCLTAINHPERYGLLVLRSFVAVDVQRVACWTLSSPHCFACQQHSLSAAGRRGQKRRLVTSQLESDLGGFQHY